MLGYALEAGRCRREQLLRGGKSYEVVRGGLASYPAFGLLAGWQEEEIEEALESLRRKGAIRVLKRGFWRDRITVGERANRKIWIES